MPEHVHLIVRPLCSDYKIADILKAIKGPVGRKGIAYLRQYAPEWLPRIAARHGEKVVYRFWQPGGGFDRNVLEPTTLAQMIDYIHANPVRRGLATSTTGWKWSSARWYAGMRPVHLEMDPLQPDIRVVQ